MMTVRPLMSLRRGLWSGNNWMKDSLLNMEIKKFPREGIVVLFGMSFPFCMYSGFMFRKQR